MDDDISETKRAIRDPLVANKRSFGVISDLKINFVNTHKNANNTFFICWRKERLNLPDPKIERKRQSTKTEAAKFPHEWPTIVDLPA